MGGWDDVGKGPIGQGGGGRFLQIPEGGSVIFRFLETEPLTVWGHKVSQVVDDEEVYQFIPGVARWEGGELILMLDDDYVQENSRRWPLQPVHHLRGIQIDKGEPVGDIVICPGGKQIYEPIKEVHEKYGDITRFDFIIKKSGKGRQTKYTVTLAPEHAKLSKNDMVALIEEMEADPAIKYENVFQIPGSAKEQQRMFEAAGFDIEYDPAAALAEVMDLDEAYQVRMPTTGGKFPGKSMRELMVIDMGYLQWVALNYTSDDRVAAAARVVVENAESTPKVGKGGAKGAIKGSTEDTRSAGQKARDAKRAARAAPVEEDENDEEEPAPRRRGRAAPVEDDEEDEPAPPRRRRRDPEPEPEDDDDEDEGEDDDDSDEDEPEEEQAPRRRRGAEAAPAPKRGDLVVRINECLGAIPKYEDSAAVARVVKKYGGGKTRVRDLDMDQLASLAEALEAERSAEEKPAKRRTR